MMKRFLGYTALLGAFAPALIVLGSTAASGDGYVSCNEPHPPSNYASYSAEYDGTGTCASTSLDTWRVKVGLAKEEINWGPIPNDWNYQDGSYGDYSTWAAVSATRYRWNYISCNAIKDDWDYKSRFKHELDWEDGHITYGYAHSDDRRLC